MSSTTPTMKSLVLEGAKAATPANPASMEKFYNIVLAFRPTAPKPSIRRTVYGLVGQGKMMRLGPNTYIAVDGPAVLVVHTGDTRELLPQMPDQCVNMIMTDPPIDMGTAENARIGSTRPHLDKGRTYEQWDLGRETLGHMFRILRQDHQWASIAQRECGACGTKVDRTTLEPKRLVEAVSGYCEKCQTRVALAPQKTFTGPGACFIWTPPRSAQTDPHIDALKRLAREVGFEFVHEIPVVYEPKGMGYWLPQEHWLLHFFTAGPVKKGVPHDLSVTSVLRVKRVMRKSKKGHADEKEQHEAEKPAEMSLAPMRLATRPGDIILDCFAGRAHGEERPGGLGWVRKALQAGRHVVLMDIDPTWRERIAQEDWGGVEELHILPEDLTEVEVTTE